VKQRLGKKWTKLDHVTIAAAISQGVIAYQRASRPVVDILSTITDFRHCTVSDFLLHMLMT